MKICLLCFAALVAFTNSTAAETVFHVAPTGSDLNSGTGGEPFATLERARQAVRMAGSGEVRRVIVHGGSYELRSTFTLGRLDSGTATRQVIWQAAPGESVRLVGGMLVPASAWQAVAEAPVLAHLDPVARGRVMKVDLGTLGVTNLPPFPVAYHGVPPGPELLFNTSRMTLARWPNEGWATIARIVESGSRPRDGDKRGLAGSFEYAGDRPARWQAGEGVWLQGYWCYDWYDEVIQIAAIDPATRRICLAAPHVYSLMQGNPSPRRYRALNVLEELDQPGEFVIDRRAGGLYLWPPADLKGAQITLATLDAPVVALEDASNITLQGFVVDSGLDNGVEVRNGTECEVVACEVRNVRRLGIRVTGGTKHRVVSCDIHHTGQGGLVLGGGERKTLTPASHEAVDNHIWRFSEHQLTSAYGLSFEGVGNRAAHNLIHDAPHQAVFVGGNDHVFEFNEVHHVCTETDDCGALYKGRNPSCRGNLIRFNYWHDIGSPMGHGNAAVYFDDGDGGDTVFGNVFVRCGEPGRGSFGTVFSHGGHDNRAENNVFVDCKRALGSAPWDDARWRDALKGGQDCFFTEKLRQEVDITKPPYTARYPELVGYLDPPAGVPRVNHARLNLLVRCGEVSGGNWRLEPGANWSTNDDPGFVDGSKGDYRLRRDAPVFKHLAGFKPIPFEKMGLQRQVPDATTNKFNEKTIKQWTLKGPLGETPKHVREDLPLSDQPNRGGWKKFELMWDEFDGPTLDTNKWRIGMSWWRGRQPAWFNPTNVTVRDGQLHLTMRREAVPPELEKLGYRNYTSAALHTQARSSYGYYEVKARPMNSGGSSSFWFQQEDRAVHPNWATEIDVFELCGKSATHDRRYYMTLHVTQTPQEKRHWQVGSYWEAPWRFAEDSHVYGFEWRKDELRWYVDGVLVRTVANTHWRQPLHLIFDSETMPEWFGMPKDNDLPSTFSIEYVRAWRGNEER